MMNSVTDIKQVYPEFKFFKDIFTSINKSQEIVFVSKNKEESICLNGSADSFYFLLVGKLFGNTKFLEWLQDSDSLVTIPMDEIGKVAKCLKKNAIGIQYDTTTFKFQMLDKDGNNIEVLLLKTPYIEDTKLKNISSMLTHRHELNDSFMSREICNIYIDGNGNPSNDESMQKILEIPTKKILSIVKDGKNSVAYSEMAGNMRYVSIRSENSNLMLEQIFATI